MTDARRHGPRRIPPPAGMTDVERLLAYQEIGQLAARYALAVGSCDTEALVELFVPDVKVGRSVRGRDALRASFDLHLRAAPVAILTVGQHVINLLEPERAAGTVYCIAELGDERSWLRQAIAYEDDYERRDGEWYFTRRDHRLFYGLHLDERPLLQEPASWPASATGRGDIPQAWPTWQDYWHKPAD
ncbi:MULTISPECIES: nuclear transport factor 2 family protein [unclassified Frankia]|uniref:nuclear transport factor 2 family protein n=1 Tax=unclassified Frankia TaxID=2632575 RepID=UPI002AD57360|nr:MULTISPECIES: nuclear transport factor 2 family protein [unclassified Frankia]